MDSPNWRSEFRRLWNELVPQAGQASTVQGELIRAIGKLTDEAYRNGNMNFRAGQRMLCEFLRVNLKDPAVFSPREIEEIDGWIDRMLDSRNLDLSGGTSCYYRLTERTVQWCQAKGELIPRVPNPKLKI